MTGDPKKTCIDSNIEQKKGHERLLKAYEIYNTLVQGKLEDFQKVKDYLAETLENLFREGKIGRGVVILSRIKSPESVVRNWRLGKNLNDILGITLLTAEQKEIDVIRAEIRKASKFDICSRKEKNEKRGYEALHFTFNVGEEKKKTRVECHLQTHEAYKNVYTHIFYKVRRELKRDLTPEEEVLVAEKVQDMYNKGELCGYSLSNGRKSRIPKMWVAGFDKDGKIQEQELNESITLTIMYPFLDISKKKISKSNLEESYEK